MSDPAVCAFLTKVVCSHGGRLDCAQLSSYVAGLSEQQLRQILEEGAPERFLLARDPGGAGDASSRFVLAVSSVRLCPQKECPGCERLHLCKLNLLGRCRVRACKYSHDVFSEENRKVLKNHELSGLNEDELRVLLRQNDPFLLPDVCGLYNRKEGNCPQKEDCKRLHVCRFFLRGTCRFPRCKRSHDLLQPNMLKLLLEEGVDDKMAWNIQTICAHKTAEVARELGPQKVPSSNLETATSGEKKKPSVTIQGEHSLSPNQAYLPFGFMNLNLKQVPSSNLETATSGEKKKPSVTIQEQHSPSPNQAYLPFGFTNLNLKQVPSLNLETATGGEKKKPSVRIQGEHSPSPNQAYLPFGFVNLNLKQDVKAAPPSKSPRNEEKKKSDEICLFYVWQFCKHKTNCEMIHYHLPYRWQIHTGNNWNDLSSMEEIEKAYCDPTTTSFQNINFKTMMSYIAPVRRQSTPSSVTKPAKFVLTTKWLWYWKNDQGQWIEYGKQDGQRQGSALNSDDLENLFLSEPDGSIPFQAGSQRYEINFKDMVQRNLHYLTQREVRRRPKYVSLEDVKSKKGHRDHSSAPIPDPIYPREWDKSAAALPELGYKAVELSKTSSEYETIEKLFQKTMNDFVIHRIRRIQNKSLWQVFQWQKDQMKKKKGGQDVEERLLFHGTGSSNLEAICSDNFDWRICGTNGTLYGKGSYFARDAHYSHSYCQLDTKVKNMFVARVLVGDFVVGRQSYSRPPARSLDMTNCYDSCVDKMIDPSIFVIFEKHQIYPAYMIYYTEEKKCVLA